MADKYHKLKYYMLSMEKVTEKKILSNDELESKFQGAVDNKMIPIGQLGHRAVQVDFNEDKYVIELIKKVSHVYYLKLCIANPAHSVALRDKTTLESDSLNIEPTQNLEICTFCIIDFKTRVLSYVGVNGSPRITLLKDWLNKIYKDDGYGAKMALICSPDVLDAFSKKKRITSLKVDIAVPSDLELERIGISETSFDNMRGKLTCMLSYNISADRGKSLFDDTGKIKQVIDKLISCTDVDALKSFKGYGKDDGETNAQIFNLLDDGVTISDKIERYQYDNGDDDKRMQIIYSTYNTKRDYILSIVQCN